MVDQQRLRTWARVALKALGTEFPYAAHHVSRDPYDCDVVPRRLHPAFHGSFDWHSSVHMQWSLVRMLTIDRAALDQAGLTGPICDLLDARLTPTKIATEVAYLHDHLGFERPYGWAWAAMLGAETWRCLDQFADPGVEATSERVACVAALITEFLPRLSHPVRHGVRGNTAFALSLMHHAYTVTGRQAAVGPVDEYARRHCGPDTAAPLPYEPSGTDFLSPALSEAELMLRVLGSEFGAWLDRFLPGLGEERVAELSEDAASEDGVSADAESAGEESSGNEQSGSEQAGLRPEHARLLTPMPLRDTADGQLAHLSGLALSKAWQLPRIATAVDDHRRGRLLDAAIALREPALPLVSEAHFASTHWLVSFALLASDV